MNGKSPITPTTRSGAASISWQRCHRPPEKTHHRSAQARQADLGDLTFGVDRVLVDSQQTVEKAGGAVPLRSVGTGHHEAEQLVVVCAPDRPADVRLLIGRHGSSFAGGPAQSAAGARHARD